VYPRTVIARPQIVVDHVTVSYAVGTWKRLLIWVVEGHTPLDQLEKLRIRIGALSRERGEHKHVALTILYPSDSSMSADERACVARMIEETKQRRLAASTAVLAQGVMGSVHRSILTGMSLLVPPPHPNKIAATEDAAIAFVHPYVVQSSGPIAAADIRAMITELYDQLRAEKKRRAV
jgi:hypothetical protein